MSSFLLSTMQKTRTNRFIKEKILLQDMPKKYNVLIEKDEGGWFVSEVIELPGCHTQAKTLDLLIKRTKEAIRAYLGEEEKPDIYCEFVGVQQIEV